MTIEDIIKPFRDRHEANEARRAQLTESIESAAAELEELAPVRATDALHAIAAEIEKRMPDKTCKVLGPFGIASEYGLHVEENGETVASISLQRDLHAFPDLVEIDLSTKTTFPEGSIGAANGLGRRTIPFNGDIDEIVARLDAQARERASA
ncbi:hypothetical protein [Croceicoccus gelatinilyticus]|uniref:hypothetical protein n=1 Tax=Croceicoccus gelatinilyticus TaxID=2835536 RepID=UPI001BCF7D28|nr:hypothetical protein [Croceicoccus gelatinilyticus]MBS7671738.1 hypothetical protein [Croceicoccus gelatinilyticus]